MNGIELLNNAVDLKDTMEDLEIDEENVTSHYQFNLADNKITPAPNLKKHNNRTRKIWSYLRNQGWKYFGVVRNWTAVFSCGTHHMTIHHFITDKPMKELMGVPDHTLDWKDLLLDEEHFPVASLLYGLEKVFNMKCMIPLQSFTDAFKQETLQGVVSEHLKSPKHKLMLWLENEEFSLLVEIFLGQQPYPPYGVFEELPWPDLQPVTDYVKQSLLDFDISMPAGSVDNPPSNREFMGIEESLPDAVLAPSREAIRKIFEENEKVICAYSGGKDSSVILQLSVEFVLENPDYQHKLHIVSASTGVENPIIEKHVRTMKDVIVRTLNKRFVDGFAEDRFVIVEPPVEDNYITCLFGSAYAPPSVNYKWCVERIKVRPARKDLMRFSDEEIICQVLGVRSKESSNRSRSVEHHYGDEFYGVHVIRCIRTAPPIRHWSATDVATFLARYPSPWTDEYSNYQLINIYGFASGDMECPIGVMITNENDAVKSCSGSSARFGCWACTVVKEDLSMKNLAEAYPDELGHYYEMRQILKGTQDIRYGGYTGYQRRRKFATFEPGYGDLTIDIRTILLSHWQRLGIPMKEEEILVISRMVKQREISEGIAVTDRFWSTLYALLPVHPGPFKSSMFHPLWEPEYLLNDQGKKVRQHTAGIDRFTDGDRKWIERYKKVCEAAELLSSGKLVRMTIGEHIVEGEVVEIQNDTFGHVHKVILERVSTRQAMAGQEWKVNEGPLKVPIASIHQLGVIQTLTMAKREEQYKLLENGQYAFEF